MSLLPDGTSAWLVTDGKAGMEAHCSGLAGALGVQAERRVVNPGRLWSALMPWGPVDPAEAPHRSRSPIAPPFPDILIASGRRSLPYLRRVKSASGNRTFTVYMQAPVISAGIADVVCVPQHDRLRGDNVLTSLTSPHRITPALLGLARVAGDARLDALPKPRLAMILGGTSRHFPFSRADAARLAAIARHHAGEGFGVMVVVSRRTPDFVTSEIRTALATTPAFVWDGTGDNPYVSILALADRLIVTGDSVNMVSEAAATGRALYIYLPEGRGHPKLGRFHAGLRDAGVIRPYAGKLDDFSYEPLDATPGLALEVARRYAAFRTKLGG